MTTGEFVFYSGIGLLALTLILVTGYEVNRYDEQGKYLGSDEYNAAGNLTRSTVDEK